MQNKRNLLVVGSVVVIILVIVGMLLFSNRDNGLEDDPVKHVAIAFNVPEVTREMIGGYMVDPVATHLVDWGYIEGENLELSLILPGEGPFEAAVQDMAARQPDVILAMGSSELATLQAADLGIPIVFSIDDVDLTPELRAQAHDPAQKLTGVVNPQMAAKRLEFLLKIAPDIQTIYVPDYISDFQSRAAYDMVQEVAPDLGVTLIPYEFTDLESEEDALNNLPENADAIFTEYVSQINRWSALALQHQIPLVVGGGQEYPQAFLNYGISSEARFMIATRFIAQILDGAAPYELPLEFTEPEIVISLGAAKAIGIEVPNSMLRSATIILREEVTVPPVEGDAVFEGFCNATMTSAIGSDSICLTAGCAALSDGILTTYSNKVDVEACSVEGIVGTCSVATHDVYFYSGDPAIYQWGCEQEGNIWVPAGE